MQMFCFIVRNLEYYGGIKLLIVSYKRLFLVLDNKGSAIV